MEAKPRTPEEKSISFNLGFSKKREFANTLDQSKEKEEKKGNVDEQEVQNSILTTQKCSLRRTKSFSNVEEFESSLKDFT